MKYFIAALIGISLGVATVGLAIYHNPWTAQNSKVGIDPAPDRTFELYYGSMIGDSIAYTNGGSAYLPRRPSDIGELWQRTLKQAHAAVHELTNKDDVFAGIGVKFGAWSRATRPLTGKVMMNSVWYIYLPGSGGFFVEQQENYWPFIRSVAIPALMDGDKKWEGEFDSDLTAGPGPAFEGLVIGGSGVLRGHRGEAREAISVAGFSMGAQHTSDEIRIRHSLTVAINAPESEVTARIE